MSSQKPRSRLTLTYKILLNCKSKPRTTMDIIHECNTNFDKFKTVTDTLVSAGFLSCSRNGNYVFYDTTGKGEALLKAYENLQGYVDLLKPLEATL